MTNIATRLKDILDTIPPQVKLVAVSKYHPVSAVAEAYAAGQRLFGESRASELKEKAATLPNDINWHFIGHLQTNKVRAILPYVHLIQSVDSERLLRTIDSEAARIGKTISILLQIHVAAEDTKFGFLPQEIPHIASELIPSLNNIRVAGIMGMATNTDDIARIESDFDAIAACSRTLRKIIPDATEISMGMSHDYILAIQRGATMVRIGTDIFGDRQ